VSEDRAAAWRQEEMHMSQVKAFTSWGQLKGASSLVVLATAGTRELQVDAHRFPWTTTTFQIDRTLIDREGTEVRTVLVRQLGPVDAATTMITECFPLFRPGAQYLLFLTPTGIIPDVSYPVGSFQGVFAVTVDGYVTSISAEVGVVVHSVPLDTIMAAVAAARSEDVNP
jgi:hypothetical protein